MYYGDLIASYKQVTYSDASITISLVFRTDGQVAFFVRESASLVTGKKDKMDTSLSRGFVCFDDRKKDPEIGLIVRLCRSRHYHPYITS